MSTRGTKLSRRDVLQQAGAGTLALASWSWPAAAEEPGKGATKLTEHLLVHGDARHMGWLGDEAVHLVVTSPPYWTLKKHNDHSRTIRQSATECASLRG